MTIFYYDKFSSQKGSRNFGDDINPFLLGKLFDRSLIENPDLCIVGIGTIVNDQNIEMLAKYKKKLIFSSGVGYGAVSKPLDETWEVVCTRGPKSAEALGVSPERGICDGAILLSDFFSVFPESKRNISVTFIPHITTDWSTGQVLRKIMKRVGVNYLVPDVPPEDFIDQVSRSRVVIAEAMHGAILADAMRVPWVPVYVHEHEHHIFKWQDWFQSIDQTYGSERLQPTVWNPPKDPLRAFLKAPYQAIKVQRLADHISTLKESGRRVLSDDRLHEEKKRLLYEKVKYVNGSCTPARVG